MYFLDSAFLGRWLLPIGVYKILKMIPRQRFGNGRLVRIRIGPYFMTTVQKVVSSSKRARLHSVLVFTRHVHLCVLAYCFSDASNMAVSWAGRSRCKFETAASSSCYG